MKTTQLQAKTGGKSGYEGREVYRLRREGGLQAKKGGGIHAKKGGRSG